MQQNLALERIQNKKPGKLKQHSFLKSLHKNIVFFPFMMPGLIAVIINQYLPIFGITIAFKNINFNDGIFRSPWVGFHNFKYLFSSSYTWKLIRNTLAYNLTFIFIGAVAALSIAIAISEIKNKTMSKLYQTTMVMPSFLSIVIITYITNTFLATESGVLNKVILPFLGMEPVKWYSEPKYWPFILLAVNLWKGAGLGSVFYLSAICGIDEELYESAIIDGATKWQQIKNITIPFLMHMAAIITLLSLGSIIRADFGLFYNVTLDRPALYPSTDVLDTYVYRALAQRPDLGMSSAASVFQSIVGCVMVILVNLITKKISPEHSLF